MCVCVMETCLYTEPLNQTQQTNENSYTLKINARTHTSAPDIRRTEWLGWLHFNSVYIHTSSLMENARMMLRSFPILLSATLRHFMSNWFFVLNEEKKHTHRKLRRRSGKNIYINGGKNRTKRRRIHPVSYKYRHTNRRELNLTLHHELNKRRATTATKKFVNWNKNPWVSYFATRKWKRRSSSRNDSIWKWQQWSFWPNRISCANHAFISRIPRPAAYHFLSITSAHYGIRCDSHSHTHAQQQ